MKLSINSDHSEAAALLQELAQECEAHGAQWHPELKAELREGSMRLLAPHGSSGELINMPTQLLVPIKGARWSSSDHDLILEQPPAELSSLQLELLNLHIALYNATGKLTWFSESHPTRLVEASPAVAAAVARVKPAHGQQQPKRSRAEGFLATRSFGYRASPDQSSTPVLMPLIDLLNHHPQGSPYRIRDGAMRVMVAQTGSSECFAHYGHRRDVLDLALHYGYSDLNTPFAHSAPMDIHVDGIGMISVQHQGQRAPIHPMDPPRVQITSDGIKISHLCCNLKHPQRATTMLRLALQGTLQKRGHSPVAASGLADRGLQAVAVENLRRLRQLQQIISKETHPGADILTSAIARQIDIFNCSF